MSTSKPATEVQTSPAAALPAVKATAKKVATKVAVKAIAKAAAKPVAKAAAKPAAKTVSKALPTVAAKPVAKGAVKPAAKVAPKPAKEKEKKIKMVRDSISIPKTEYAVLDDMKLRAGKLGVSVKKTELIRAGIKALAALSDTAFLAGVRAVPSLKTGRPAKSE